MRNKIEQLSGKKYLVPRKNGENNSLLVKYQKVQQRFLSSLSLRNEFSPSPLIIPNFPKFICKIFLDLFISISNTFSNIFNIQKKTSNNRTYSGLNEIFLIRNTRFYLTKEKLAPKIIDLLLLWNEIQIF